MAEEQERRFVEELTEIEDDFDRWYVAVVRKAELADESPVRGTRVIRPYGFALWENMQAGLDRRIKATGVQNAYFPLFIPRSMFEREAEHIEGFAPEVAWVTRGGNKELEEPWAVRPTSEAIICPMYARWVQSYRDLPILINQWSNVVRWEERPRAFLRSLEFLWQEGHTAHASLDEAEERARLMLDVYQEFVETELAIPAIPGQKTESEKFAGALRTYTIEAMMGGKKWALQSGTSHNLGDHFGRVFGIEFLDASGERRFAFNTSWGLSFRTLGAIIMVHGDERGLKLPPRVAPYQVVIVPISGKPEEQAAVAEVRAALEPVARVYVDARDDKRPGWKFNEWELKGVPVRLEIGPRDVQNESVVLVRRDNRAKEVVPVAALETRLPELLEEVQRGLFQRALDFRAKNMHYADNYDQFKQIIAEQRGFVRVKWAEDSAAELAIKEETKATLRVIPFDQPEGGVQGKCFYTGKPATCEAIFARSY